MVDAQLKKAVILAAGLGTRMAPLTQVIPKPMLPFAGIELLYIILWQLKKMGINQVAINGHHLVAPLKRAIQRNPWDQTLYFSDESAKILGSGGVYPKLQPWRGDSPILAYNGDILSDFPIDFLWEQHLKHQPLATLALRPEAPPGKFAVWLQGNRIVAFSKEKPDLPDVTARGFAGIQILSDRLIGELPHEDNFEIIPVYQDILKENGYLCGHLQECLWFDIGTPDQYFLAHKIWIDGLSEASLGATDPFDILTIHEKMQKSFQYFPAKSMEVSQKDIVGPSFLSGYVNVTPKCHIGPYTFVFGDSTLGQEYKIDRSILLGPPPKNDQSLSKVITHQDMTIHLNIPD